MQNYDQLITQLRKNQFAPIYLLCGTEPFYIDKALEWFDENSIPKQYATTDKMTLYGTDVPNGDFAHVVNMARTVPMFGQHKLIILKEAQKIKKWEAAKLYFKSPQKTTILVMVMPNTVPDKRLAIWKEFENQGNVWMQSDKIKGDAKIEMWTREYINRQIDIYNREHPDRPDISVDAKVPALLANYIGNDLQTLTNAVEKLITGLPTDITAIDASTVERNIGLSKDFNVFELQDALFEKNITKANTIVDHFAKSKDHPMVKELGILFNAFANLMIYHYLPDKNDNKVASVLGIPPFFVNKYRKAATLYSAAKTFRIIGYFREIDAKNKGFNGNSTPEGDLWKELIFKILY